MQWISNKTVKIGGIYSSLEEAFEFCWSLFTDEHNTLVKLTRKNVKFNKFGCGTPWIPGILFTSPVWNFCRWVTDIPPHQTSPAMKSEAKWLFSKAIFVLTATLHCQQNGRRWDASTKQRSQGKFSVEHWFCILQQQKHDCEINQSADCRVNVSWMCDSQNYRSIMWQHCVWKILIGQFSQASKQIHHIIKFLSFWSLSNVLTSFRIGIAVSGLMLRQKAKEFSEDPEFKESLGWYQKWKHCHSVSLRTKTTLA